MTAMGNEIPIQLAQFFRSILLGASLALLYDLTRVLRKPGNRLLDALLDSSISICAILSVFLFVMAEEGELRLFILLGAGGGAVLFFSVLSGVLRPVLTFWRNTLFLPFHLGYIFAKNMFVFCKKVFSFFTRWFTIIVTQKSTSNREEREHGPQIDQTENSP